MNQRVLAVLESPEEALSAVTSLKAEGVGMGTVSVMSSEPIPELVEEFEASRKSRAAIAAVAGAVIGALSAWVLTVWTSKQMGLTPGGMPVVTPWAFGIVIFELTAGGATLASLFAMLWGARLPRSGPEDEAAVEVADGNIVIAVDCDNDETSQRVLNVLESAGANILKEN